MFGINKDKSTSGFLRKINKLSKKYSKSLEQKQFIELERKEGPGMGALISYTNSHLTICLINDRNQLFIDIHPNHNSKETFSLAFLISMIKLYSYKKEFVELSKKEKYALYEINCDLNDPFDLFFKYYDDIITILNEDHYAKTRKELNDFFKERGKWLFPN